MITDTLCSSSQGLDIEKHHPYIVALVITLELIISSQTWGIQRVFEIIRTRISRWIFSPLLFWFIYAWDYECQIRSIYPSAHFTSPNNLCLWGFGLMSFYRTWAARRLTLFCDTCLRLSSVLSSLIFHLFSELDVIFQRFEHAGHRLGAVMLTGGLLLLYSMKCGV